MNKCHCKWHLANKLYSKKLENRHLDDYSVAVSNVQKKTARRKQHTLLDIFSRSLAFASYSIGRRRIRIRWIAENVMDTFHTLLHIHVEEKLVQ